YDTQADEKGLWSLPILDALADDVYTFTVTATDQAGNVGRFSESLQIDTTLPLAAATLTEGSDSGVQGDNITKDQF
ncbi:Ig-like domain-containing protein, partial [Providencia rettgeri]|uniref:Ig-like domain-containing protein n=1 Tax=Providencia rettgeri TaxID=587 RepID=UPI0013A56EF3